MPVKPIPEGFHALTPYLLVSDGVKFIEFLKKAFGAKEIHRSMQPDGRLMHAQMQIGDSFLMMGEPMGEYKAMPASIYVYTEDTDALYRRALAAGATSAMEPADQFYGDRSGGVKDAWGNLWWIATHIEDVSLEEINERVKSARHA